MYGEMQRPMTCVLLVIASLIMVQYGSDAAPDPSDSSASTEQSLHIGKSFAHCEKLVKDNYLIWMTGIITMLMSYTGYRGIEDVLTIVQQSVCQQNLLGFLQLFVSRP